MAMPEEIKDIFGYALDLAQRGERHPKAKPFHLDGESGLIEVVESYAGNAYRALYTVHYANAVYVVHCFQKKSHSGIKTPDHHIDLIRARIKRLRNILAGG